MIWATQELMNELGITWYDVEKRIELLKKLLNDYWKGKRTREIMKIVQEDELLLAAFREALKVEALLSIRATKPVNFAEDGHISIKLDTSMLLVAMSTMLEARLDDVLKELYALRTEKKISLKELAKEVV